MSYSPPSGLRSGRIQISRLLTRLVMCGSTLYWAVNCRMPCGWTLSTAAPVRATWLRCAIVRTPATSYCRLRVSGGGALVAGVPSSAKSSAARAAAATRRVRLMSGTPSRGVLAGIRREPPLQKGPTLTALVRTRLGRRPLEWSGGQSAPGAAGQLFEHDRLVLGVGDLGGELGRLGVVAGGGVQ